MPASRNEDLHHLWAESLTLGIGKADHGVEVETQVQAGERCQGLAGDTAGPSTGVEVVEQGSHTFTRRYVIVKSDIESDGEHESTLTDVEDPGPTRRDRQHRSGRCELDVFTIDLRHIDDGWQLVCRSEHPLAIRRAIDRGREKLTCRTAVAATGSTRERIGRRPVQSGKPQCGRCSRECSNRRRE
jgi:hypothetical protein